MVYVTDLNIADLKLTIFQILEYDNPTKVLKNILINSIDEKEVFNILAYCDSSTAENNKYYDYVYHGFFEYLKERGIWYSNVSKSSYKW